MKKLLTIVFILFIFLFISVDSYADTLSSKILKCKVEGDHGMPGLDNMLGKRVLELIIVPPSKDQFPFGDQILDLWIVKENGEPKTLVKRFVGVGSIEVNYGSYSETRELTFLQIGKGGTSHVAVWTRKGLFEHPNFLRVNVWDKDKPIWVMESVEPSPFLTGHCE